MNLIVKIVLVACFMGFGYTVSAQEYIVKSFEIMQDDIDARVNPRVGANGRKCALLKVYVQDGISHVNGSVIGDIETKGMEKRIYMAHESKQVELVFDNHFPLRIKFDDYRVPLLTEQTVYILKLIDENSGSGQSGNVLAETPVSQTESTLKEAIAAYNEGYYDKAMTLFLKISDDSTAQYYLGIMYNNGQGVTQDYSEAVRWYRKSAEQGNARAQYDLGCMYEIGHGVTQDYSEAVRWFRKSAEQGNARGQSALGFMYENGRGVSQDYSEAVRWFRKSAEQGDVYGQFYLAIMYVNGWGVPKNYSEAIRWHRKSAEQGHRKAQYGLGYIYENGLGVTPNKTEAIRWYRKSADQNYGKAINALERLNVE